MYIDVGLLEKVRHFFGPPCR